MSVRDEMVRVLSAHLAWTFNHGIDDYVCVCGERLGNQCQSDYAANKALWKHQADALIADGWTKPTGEPVRTYYRSLTPDGKLWCESRDPDEVVQRSEGEGITFERSDVWMVTQGWKHWNPTEEQG